MRKLGNRFVQKSTKTVRKSVNQILGELTTAHPRKVEDKEGNVKKVKQKGVFTQKQIAKQLKISDRSYRAYKKYFASLDNPDIKLGKNDRVPRDAKKIKQKILKFASSKKVEKALTDKAKKVLEKRIASTDNKILKAKLKKQLRKLKKVKIKKTRSEGKKFDRSIPVAYYEFATKSTWEKLMNEKKILGKKFKGFLTRINLMFITKNGTFSDWVAWVYTPESRDDYNEFIQGEIQKIIDAKNSILGYEILEVIIDITLNEYKKNR